MHRDGVYYLDLNNPNDIVLAKSLQSCKHMKTMNSCRIYLYSY